MATGGWIEWDKVDFSFLRKIKYAARNPGNQATKFPRDIKDILCAWDVETSILPGEEQAFVYHWQMQIGFDMPTIRGRTIEEFRLCMDRVEKELTDNETLICFIHNLGYEFFFLRSVYPELTNDDIFATGPRKPVKVKLYGGKIELRCSYILTNMSLAAWTHKYNVEHAKCSSADYDHSKTRFPWDSLSEEELEYCRNDVLGLIEALKIHLEINHDTLATVVLTSTGFVRRAVKRVMEHASRRMLQDVQPTEEVYLALREAFRGGDTHCNRYMAGIILKNVSSVDRSSSYPDVCVNRMFPMGKFKRSWIQDYQQLRALIKMGRAVLVRLRFEGLRLKDDYTPCPYISFSKIRDPVEGRKKSDFLKTCKLDNGRILQAEIADTTLTDVDWKIVRRQYIWDKITVLDMWDTRYDYLPDMLRSLIIQYYQGKTELKGVPGQELYYALMKALLNSIYGMMAQDVAKPKIVYYPEYKKGRDLFEVEEGDIEALLAKSRYKPYKGYQWGVWCTALAREELHRVINIAGDNFVYCDTDSIKFVGELDLTDYNAEKIRNSTENGAFATDPNGEAHYMGVFEREGTAEEFISLGAKKYAYKDSSGLHITVAGVGKKTGAKELENAGGLPAFKPGMIFSEAGGVEAVYNDFVSKDVVINGHVLHIGPNVCLVPSTYKLGLSNDYAELLEDIDLLRYIQHEEFLKSALTPKG